MTITTNRRLAERIAELEGQVAALAAENEAFKNVAIMMIDDLAAGAKIDKRSRPFAGRENYITILRKLVGVR